MKIMGTKFIGHDSAVCLIDTRKQEIFAISTERITRIKHDEMSIDPILKEYNEFLKEVDYVVHGDTFSSLLTARGPMSAINSDEFNMQLRDIFEVKYIKDLIDARNGGLKKMLFRSFKKAPIKSIILLNKGFRAKINKNKLNKSQEQNQQNMKKFIKNKLEKNNIKFKNITFFNHHLCHTAGAYYTSPFYNEKAFSLSIDGFGDGYFSNLYIFEKNNYKLIGKGEAIYVGPQHYDLSSIGKLYGKFVDAMDLHRKSDAGKVEALAAYGKKDEKLYNELMQAYYFEELDIKTNVEVMKKLYDVGYLKTIRKEIGDENFCATVQSWLEDLMVNYINLAYDKYKIDNLCLSGGVAANIIMSLNIYERTPIKNIFVMPAMGDDGIALGSAILQALEKGEDISWIGKKYYMPYYGHKITENEIKDALNKFKDKVMFEYIGEEWYKEAAKSLSENKIISIVHGKMEFGPRALGNRSILANPVFEDVRDRINSKIKKRPWYQPFCPSILEEERERLFEKSFPHKHMAIAFRMKKEYIRHLPTAVHVDGTARPQFVEEKDNPVYYKLLKELKKYTGFGVCINTSFNLHGRTMVRTAEDALTDFIDCQLDEMYLEGYKIVRLMENH